MTITIQDLIDELNSIDPSLRHLPAYVADWSDQDTATGQHYPIYSISAFDEDQPISQDNLLAINAVISSDAPEPIRHDKSFHFTDAEIGRVLTFRHPKSLAHALILGDIRPGFNAKTGTNNTLVFATKPDPEPTIDDFGIAITTNVKRWMYENPPPRQRRAAYHQRFTDFIIDLVQWSERYLPSQQEKA